MKKHAYAPAILAALALLGTPSLEAQSSPWIHIQVTEDDERPSKVNVNLPLSVVKVALEVAPEKVFSHGRLRIGRRGHDISVSDLRRMWRELRDAGEAEFVSIEDGDETVKIFREGDVLQVQIDNAEKEDRVRVEVPVSVIDALLSGEGEELNLEAALAELENQRGEVVRVRDGESRVLIWIDEKS
ncbi:MAG: hypothetical protein ACE5JI_10250 [Acidobacteriota bacterium]